MFNVLNSKNILNKVILSYHSRQATVYLWYCLKSDMNLNFLKETSTALPIEYGTSYRAENLKYQFHGVFSKTFTFKNCTGLFNISKNLGKQLPLNIATCQKWTLDLCCQFFYKSFSRSAKKL